jgi:hypothetical protein
MSILGMIGVPFRAVLALLLTIMLIGVDCVCIPVGIIFFGEISSLTVLALPDLYRWVLLMGVFE